MTRAQLILKLIQTYHLSVPERRQLVPSGIDFTEIVAVIRDVVERERRFSSGSLTLENLDGVTFRFRYLEYDPLLGDLVNECSGPSVPAFIDYGSLDMAVAALMVYLKATRDIDGIGISGFSGRNELGCSKMYP